MMGHFTTGADLPPQIQDPPPARYGPPKFYGKYVVRVPRVMPAWWTEFRLGFLDFWAAGRQPWPFLIGFVVAFEICSGMLGLSTRLIVSTSDYAWAHIGAVPLLFWIVLGGSVWSLVLFALGALWWAGYQLRQAERTR